MSVKDMWQRTQVYFGIKEEDWEEDYFDDDGSAAHEDLESRYNERPNVRRLNPRRRSGADFDDIFSDEPPPQRGRGRQPAAQNGGQRHAAPIRRPADPYGQHPAAHETPTERRQKQQPLGLDGADRRHQVRGDGERCGHECDTERHQRQLAPCRDRDHHDAAEAQHGDHEPRIGERDHGRHLIVRVIGRQPER